MKVLVMEIPSGRSEVNGGVGFIVSRVQVGDRALYEVHLDTCPVVVVDINGKQECLQKENVVPWCPISPAADSTVVVSPTDAWVCVVALKKDGEEEG
jgi:hypothetical protein